MRVSGRILVRYPGSLLNASMTRATGAATPRGFSVRGATGETGRGGSGRNADMSVGYRASETETRNVESAGDGFHLFGG